MQQSPFFPSNATPSCHERAVQPSRPPHSDLVLTNRLVALAGQILSVSLPCSNPPSSLELLFLGSSPIRPSPLQRTCHISVRPKSSIALTIPFFLFAFPLPGGQRMSRYFVLVPKDVKAKALLKVRVVARNSLERRVSPLNRLCNSAREASMAGILTLRQQIEKRGLATVRPTRSCVFKRNN